jgi:hypothetical protein
VDGGNVGISLRKSHHNKTKPVFRFQKRAHYVSPASESQFRGLDLWAEKNARALRTLLRMPLSNFVRSSFDLWRSLHRSMAQFFTLTESLLHRTMQLRENNTPTRTSTLEHRYVVLQIVPQSLVRESYLENGLPRSILNLTHFYPMCF